MHNSDGRSRSTSTVAENAPKMREDLMMNKVLLKPNKDSNKTTQRKALFRTACKAGGKCYKVVIDSGSTENLVST